SGGKLINRIVIFRRQYAQDMGFVIPSVRLHDSSSLGTNQYVIRIKGEEVARGEILVDYFLALEPASPAGEIDGIETIEPSYGIPSRWILPENKEMAEIYGYTVIDPLSVMLTHLSETIKKHAHELLTRGETIQLVENLKKTAPELVEEAFPELLSYATFEKLLRNLLREGVPIKDMMTIVETAADALTQTRDIDMVTENVRCALSRTITRRFCEHGQLRVVTLDAEVEKRVIASLTKNEQGVYLAMGPELMQQIISQLAENLKKFNELSQTPIVLTSQIIRTYLSRMIAQFYANVYVLSFNEITSNVQIQAIGNITLQPGAAAE
ncbi:MAG: flagellar biosynthesis protein FlhA, partial [Oscillospiraceae bacterium]